MTVVLLVVISFTIFLGYRNECLNQFLESSSSLYCWVALTPERRDFLLLGPQG